MNTITCAKDVERCLKETLQVYGLAFDPFESDSSAAITVKDADINADTCVLLVIVDKEKIDVNSEMWKESFYKFNFAMKDNEIILAEAIYKEEDKAYLIYSTSSPNYIS